MTCAQWLVLDNLKNNWPYQTNLAKDLADEAYLWCVRNECIKDGKLTVHGQGFLLANPYPKG